MNLHFIVVTYNGQKWIKQCLDFSDSMLNDVDVSIGFEHRTESNYLRFPLWLIYNTSPTSDDPGKRFVEAMNRKWSEDRPIFCSQVASHDHRGNGAGNRELCFHTISKIAAVLNCGKWGNNSDLLKKRYVDVVDYLLRDCRFNICLENSLGNGYVTEKIFRPLLAGSIPIYWGVPGAEPNVLHQDSYLWFDPENPDELMKRVVDLNNSDASRSKFINASKIQPQARDWINHKHEELKKAFRD